MAWLNDYAPRRLKESQAADRAEREQLLASARATLGDEVYTAAREAGRRMNVDDAVSYALKQLRPFTL